MAASPPPGALAEACGGGGGLGFVGASPPLGPPTVGMCGGGGGLGFVAAAVDACEHPTEGRVHRVGLTLD